MQTTKGHLLALLKRRGRRTVDALAEELGLAPMTVRQHLTSLERDGLIDAKAERQRKGRPHYLYALTDKGEQSFPKRYDHLVIQILAELGRLDPSVFSGLTPDERTDYVLRRLADRLVEQHAGRLAACSLEERVREVAAILQEESGFVEWSETAEGFEICDYNCMYQPLADAGSTLCTWHRHLISRLVGLPPVCDGVPPVDALCCRFVMVTQVNSAAPSRDGTQASLLSEKIPQEVH
jgi:predicted ArsR family transcriptional regulator